MIERVKKSSPNPTSVFTSRKRNFTKKKKIIGIAAKFGFIQGEAGKYFPDFACR